MKLLQFPIVFIHKLNASLIAKYINDRKVLLKQKQIITQSEEKRTKTKKKNKTMEIVMLKSQNIWRRCVWLAALGESKAFPSVRHQSQATSELVLWSATNFWLGTRLFFYFFIPIFHQNNCCVLVISHFSVKLILFYPRYIASKLVYLERAK